MSRKRALIWTGYTVLMLVLCGFWYRYQWQPTFHFFDDFKEWAYLDKLGHLLITYWLASLLLWNEAESKKPAAVLTAFLMVSGIELADAFSADYGFSPYDLMANAGGAFLAFFYPAGKSVALFKFSFWPSVWASQRPELLGHHWAEQVIKDYNGQSYWISIPLPHLIWPRIFPPWLGISLGYGAGGMLYGQNIQNPALFTEWMLSPDILLSRIPVQNNVLKSIFGIADLFKLPFILMIWRSDIGFNFQFWPF